MKLDRFNFDLHKDPYNNLRKLKIFIDLHVKNKKITDFLYLLSLIFDCPKNILDLKLKKLIFNKYNFSKKKFILNNSKGAILKDFLLFFTILFVTFFFSKLPHKKKKYDIIYDNIDDYNQFFKYKKLSSKFDSALYVCKKNFYLHYFEEQIYREGIFDFYLDNFFLNSVNLIKLYFCLLKYSFSSNENYINLFNILLISILKNQYFFLRVNSKYLINDRFYLTCPIRNFFFKKNDGIISGCTQLHHYEPSIGFYCDIDVLFTFGNEEITKKRMRSFGGRVIHSHPIGSLQMEHLFFGNKKFYVNKKHYKKKIDILFIGLNKANWYYLPNVKKQYTKCLIWIRNLSNKYPELTIKIKHHSNSSVDPIEEKIFRNSNVKIIKKNYDLKKIKGDKNTNKISYYNKSYEYLIRSDTILSFGSTMVLESNSLGKKVYFCNPNLESTNFFLYCNYLNNFIIKDYKELIKKVNSKKKDYTKICLDSRLVSDRIFNYLIKYDK